MFNWPIWSLLRTVFGAILEVFLLCVVGYALARQGILDKTTQRQLNRLNVSLFTPSLLFSKVAFSLSPSKLRELWIIPIGFVVTTSVSVTVAYTFGSMLRLKHSQRNFAMAASMFMNSNSLPIAIMQSLVYTVPQLRWGDDDDVDIMLGRALTYLVLYSTLGMVLRWSYGVHLLSQAAEQTVSNTTHSQEPTENSPLIPSESPQPKPYISGQSLGIPPLDLTHAYEPASSGSSAPDDRRNPNDIHFNHVGGPPLNGPNIPPRFFQTFPNTPAVRSEVSSESGSEDELPAGNDPRGRPRRTGVLRKLYPVRTFLRRMNNFMTVPMWAALASLIVACVQPLQHVLEMHVSPIKAALTAAGNCSIPLTLVVLGAYFHNPTLGLSVQALPRPRAPGRRQSDQSLMQGIMKAFDVQLRRFSHSRGRDEASGIPGETKTVIIAVLSRMILTPLILLPALTALIAFDAHSVLEDPVFVVSNVLLITSPPALTLAQITQAASGDAFERLISKTIFWAYCIVTPPLTIISVVVGLLLSKL